VEYFPTS